MVKGLIYTLVFVKNESNVLLGLKKRGLGEGKWNGFGGKVEKNENVLDGAIRETKEESNLNITNLKHIGVVAYEEKAHSKTDIVHIFTTNNFTGNMKETEEMKPQWFKTLNIPYQQMWPDSKIWYPLMLKEKYFFAHIVYDEECTYKSCNIQEFDSLTSVLKLTNCIP